MSELGAVQQAEGRPDTLVPGSGSFPAGATERDGAERGAAALGRRLADLVAEPEAFLAELTAGLGPLADAEYRTLAAAISPGTPAPYAVRGTTREALLRPVRGTLRRGSSADALRLAERLSEAGDRDLRLYALPCLARALADDPAGSWQLLRGMAAGVGDWIEVDSLAETWSLGILAESSRWSELEQLVYSPRPFERRLVGATAATIPHRVPVNRREELGGELSRRSLDLVTLLMGDAEEPVQKALSWALRNWSRFDPAAVSALLDAETAIAVRDGDGARAWVIRDSLSHQPPEHAAALRLRLAGLRRDRRAPSTSIAAARSATVPALDARQTSLATPTRITRSRA
jgi:3-methyladenine DNA glycosylase AlkD